MSTVIRTRSPYFIRTNQSISSVNPVAYFNIKITFYTGNGSSQDDCDLTYEAVELNKFILSGEKSVSFDISELTNDVFQQVFNGSYNDTATYNSFWVSVNLSARKADGTLIAGSAESYQFLAQEGYNLFQDGVNYTFQKAALITASCMDYNVNGQIVIPVNMEQTTEIWWYNGSESLGITNLVHDNKSQDKIRYIQQAPIWSESKEPKLIDKAIFKNGETVLQTIYLNPIEECKYEVNTIIFLNRWGAMQELLFFKKKTESIKTSNENFDRSIFNAKLVTTGPGASPKDPCVTTTTYNTYSKFAHSRKSYNTNGNESITLNSGFVGECSNSSFEELMLSEYVWFRVGTLDSNLPVPVTLTDSSFNRKTGLNDKLINYTMNFDVSNSIINNIR